MSNLWLTLAHWPDFLDLIKDEEDIRLEIKSGKEVEFAKALQDLRKTAHNFNVTLPPWTNDADVVLVFIQGGLDAVKAHNSST